MRTAVTGNRYGNPLGESMNKTTGRNTKERILIATEYLLARNGLSISMRSIACTARVNIASINYYFETKEHLIKLVIKRRFALVNEACIRELQRIRDTRTDGTRGFSVSRILRTYVAPFFGSAKDMVFMGRAMMDPDRSLHAASVDAMKPSREMLLGMLCEALPELPEKVVRLKFSLSIGTLSCALLLAGTGGASPDRPQYSNRDCRIDALASFLGSAFQAPFPEEIPVNPASEGTGRALR